MGPRFSPGGLPAAAQFSHSVVPEMGTFIGSRFGNLLSKADRGVPVLGTEFGSHNGNRNLSQVIPFFRSPWLSRRGVLDCVWCPLEA